MSYHSRMMNLPPDKEPVNGSSAYRLGHRDARHAAAEIANEADAEIDQLRELCKQLAEALDEMRIISGPPPVKHSERYKTAQFDCSKVLASYKQVIHE
jgi:hypothetical protein